MSDNAPACTSHCWHLADEQHIPGNHSDWKCCWCGQRQCAGPGMVARHGPRAGEQAQKGCGVILGEVVLP